MGRTTMGIPFPETPNDFQINHHLLLAVKNAAFSGRPDEKALDHLDTFHRLCSVYPTNGTPIETVKAILFPFSLADEAEQWVKATPSESFATWQDVEKEFLNAFFPQHLTRKMRTNIANFRQRKDETFNDAWKRFEGYLRDCPHHGLKKGPALAIFYRGCEPHHRELLDASSGGSFTDLSTEKGEMLIRKTSKNSYSNREQYNFEQKEVFFCGSGNPHDDGSSQMLRDMNREDARREEMKQRREPLESEQFRAKPTLTRSNSRNITCQRSTPSSYQNNFEEMKDMIRSAMKAQEADMIRLDESMDRMGRRISNRIDKLNSEHRKLSVHIGVLDEKLAKESALLEEEAARARSIEYCQFLDLNGINSTKDGSQSPPGHCSKEMDLNTLRNNTALRENPVMRETSSGFKVMMRPDSKVTTPPPENRTILGGKRTDMVYSCHTKLPSHNLLSTPLDGGKRKMMEEAHAKILSAIEIMNGSEEGRLLLENDGEFRNRYEILLAAKAKVEEKKQITGKMKTEDPVAHFHPSPISEPEDPGNFSIPCIVNGTPMPKCILDLGASKSIMPLKMARLAGITNFKRTNTKMVLADWTTRKLEGIAENVPVDFNGSRFLTNFMILDTSGEASSGVILGRPFLVASKAQITADKGIVTFGAKQQGSQLREWTAERKRNKKNVENEIHREYGFFLSTVRERMKTSNGKSSNFKGNVNGKTWRVKEESDPGDYLSGSLKPLRVPPAH